MDAAAIKAKFDEHKVRSGKDIRKVKVGGFDVDGVLRGKYVSLDKFWSVVEQRLRLLRRHLRLGHRRRPLRQREGHRLAHGLPRRARDASIRRRFALSRWEPDTAAFLVDFVNAGRQRRTRPARARSSSASLGDAREARATRRRSASEFEFWVFQETPESLHEKGFREPHAAHARHVRLLVAARGAEPRASATRSSTR